MMEDYTNIKSEMRSFKSNENIHKKEGGSYYVVSANKASSVTLQHMKRESVFHALPHTLTRKRKYAGISVIISLSCATNGTVFFTVKLDPTNSFSSNTAEVRHIYLKLTAVFS